MRFHLLRQCTSGTLPFFATLSVWTFFLFIVGCAGVSAEKKYIFKPGSRQAIEVESNGSATSSTAGNATGNVYGQGRQVIRRGMSRRPSASSAGGGGSYLHSGSGSGRSTKSRTGRQHQLTKQSTSKKRSYHFTDYVEVDGIKRSFYAFVPETYEVHRASPLLLVFHGLGMSGESMPAVTGFNGIARRNSFVVVYCKALGKRWNDGMHNRKGIDDLKYVRAVLKKISSRVNIDKRHVFSVGLSNGGYFSQMVASSMPDQIAGVASVASTAMRQGLSDTGRRTSRAIPAVFFLGTEDPLVNWADGKKRDLGRYGDKLGVSGIDPGFYAMARYGGWMSAEDVIKYWTARNGCTSNPRVSLMPDRDRSDGMRVERIEYGSRGNAVTVYKIIGGFHSWPGALPVPGSKVRSCQDIAAGELIWKFFREKAW